MREIRPYGSVRGVRRKPYPYRDIPQPDAKQRVLFLGRHRGQGKPQTQQGRPRGTACGQEDHLDTSGVSNHR